MNREDRIYELQQALAQMPPDEWAGFLAAACLDDSALGDEVLRRQRAMEDDDPTRATPPAFEVDPKRGASAAGGDPSQESEPLAIIGNYRLLRRIGEGGMGIVYEAEQQHPRRAVAVKVIRGGALATDLSIKLFEREAQALGRLKHPGIAAIYEAGQTSTGQHFFAMELVHGVQLLEYARSLEGVPSTVLRQRLEVLCRVGRAVSYAHQRGVIHRDLKPSNILVIPSASRSAAESTTGPDVRILDFGLARITDANASVALHTQPGVVAGTLAYMSPEQTRGNPDEIDVRTDVYSLGAILYELLTGAVPVDVSGLSMAQALRIIEEQPPARPSSLWVAARPNRSERPLRLDQDLVTITLKTLEKEPSRRYQSAVALVEDLERYLRNEPILARPASATYQLTKLVARHKAGFAFAAVVVLLLVAFAATFVTQSARTARERDRALAAESRSRTEAESAKRVAEFLVDIFEVSDPSEAKGNTVTAREILDKAGTRVVDELNDEPALQATFMDTIGRVYHNLGLIGTARNFFEESLTRRRDSLGGEHPLVATSLTNLGEILMDGGDYQAAEPHLRQAVSIHRQRLPSGDTDATDLAYSLETLGHFLYLRGAFEESERLLREALELHRVKSADPRSEVANSMSRLAQTLTSRGSYDEAERLFRGSLEMNRQLRRSEHTEVAVALGNLAQVHMMRGDVGQAETGLREALALWRKLVGEFHPEVSKNLNNLAMILQRQGKLDEAISLMRQVTARLGQQYGPDHPILANTLRNLANMLVEGKKPREAKPLYADVLRIQRVAFAEDNTEIAYTNARLGRCLSMLGEYERAERLLLASHSALQAGLGADHRFTVIALDGVIDLYEAWEKPDQASRYRAQKAGPAKRP